MIRWLILLLLIPSLCFADSETTIGGYTASPHLIQVSGDTLAPSPYLDFIGATGDTLRGVTYIYTGSSSGSGTVGPGTVGQDAVFNSSNTINSGVITDNGTNVGIGTSSALNSALTIQGTLAINNSGPSLIGAVNGINLDPANLSASNPAITILSNGNVGIGLTNTTPGAPLEVIGNEYLGNLGSTSLTFNANGTNFAQMWTNGGGGDSVLYVGGSNGINNTPTTSALTVDVDSNNVGIGTLVPHYTLDVQGSARMTGLVIPGNNVANGYVWTSTGTDGGAHWATAGAASQTPWAQNINGAGYQLVSAGNIGIGSATPGQALDVVGTARMTGFMLSGNGAASGFMLEASGALGIGTWVPAPSGGGANPGGSATQLQYQVNGTTFGGVTGSSVVNGNIGVGSANPGQILDVTGTVRATNLIDTSIASGTQCLHANSAGAISGTGSDCGSGGGGITVGTTSIASGTNKYVEYNNSSILGEYSVTGTGTAVSLTTGSFTNGNLRQSDANSNDQDSGLSTNLTKFTISVMEGSQGGSQ